MESPAAGRVWGRRLADLSSTGASLPARRGVGEARDLLRVEDAHLEHDPVLARGGVKSLVPWTRRPPRPYRHPTGPVQVPVPDSVTLSGVLVALVAIFRYALWPAADGGTKRTAIVQEEPGGRLAGQADDWVNQLA